MPAREEVPPCPLLTRIAFFIGLSSLPWPVLGRQILASGCHEQSK